ncbi:SgcJ/EcaC family oxidoreductase [Streptacidiphilus sp. MAP12-33]|uniref:YybH family protein n=1 Tax=Streptacidiphilus sp. MAP12-33 TaxID=3156266 RepID=UPI0035134BE0
MNQSKHEVGVVHEVVERWTAAFNSRDLKGMAALFAPDALFQGFGPEPLVGRDAVAEYYGAVPNYRRAEDVSVLHAWAIGQEAAGGFVDVTFRDPADWEARVYLSLVLQRTGDRWEIRQYHVSRVSNEH